MAASSKSSKIICHKHPEYVAKRQQLGPAGMYNGAYYYSKEIVDNIIPNVKTKRPWVTVNIPGVCSNHAIFFAHKNVDLHRYDWLKDYSDLVIVCSVKETAEGMKKYGKTIYLPLSIDVDHVKQFKRDKHDLKWCYCGNAWKFKRNDLHRFVPPNCPNLCGMPRDELLKKMSRYSIVYAIGRCAIEAKALGCEVRTCDSRFPDPDMWQVLDNKEAAKMLQEELDKIDGKKGGKKCNKC